MPSIVAFKGVSQPSANSRSLTLPTTWTPQVDDRLVLCGGSDQLITTINVTSPWINPLGGSTYVASDQHCMCAVHRLITSAEAAAATRTYTASGLFSPSRAGIAGGFVVRGVDPTTPIDDISVAFSSVDTANPHSIPGLPGSNVGTGSLVVSCAYPDGAETYPGAADYTTLIAQATGAAGRSFWLGSRDTLTTAGVDVAATPITPSVGDEFVAMTFAFKPLVVVPDTGKFFVFFPTRKAGGQPPAVVHDAGLSEPFQYAPAFNAATGISRNVVTGYGATPGNSSNDDRTAIQNAINAANPGDEVYIPDGVYHVKGRIDCRASVNIRGQSQAGVVINTMLSSSATSLFKIPTGAHDIRIEDFTLQKLSGSDFDAPFRLGDQDLTTTVPAIERVIIRHVTIKNHKRFAVEAHNTKHLLVDSCIMRDAVALDGGGQGYGVLLADPGSNNNWARSNTIGPTIRHALLAVNKSHHNLFGGTLDGLPGAARGPGYVPAANECGNTIVGCVADAIDMHGERESNCEISYNKVYNNVRDGTNQSPNGAGICIGEPYTDDVLGGSGHGRSGDGHWVHHNEVYGCPQGFLIMDESNYCSVEDNWFHNNDKGIAAFEATGYPTPGVLGLAIRRNLVTDNIDNIWLEDGVVGAVIEDNISTGATGFGLKTDVTCTGYLIRRNTITGNGTNVSLGSLSGTYVP
jgi:hypothetical protein